ncbi:hypothetical protein THF1C08_80236 [Vibrio jasicida]|uniref:AbrB family transcriptional regulator n=1 Tax=Vibrio jasicida TaxID=766224 RepID=A0AAU9QWH1_9VIBR|nr:hypothetical protein THF1C08_80236 [Vibrio jasicida]CAH1603516.1 hypothetical protein THF1A12_70235 [Vibrio jasicida]
MEVDKKTMKQLGVRVPKNVKLFYTETDKEYQFSFTVKKVGKRGHEVG